jgi:Phage terminase large subunit gpA, ATPase domain
MTGANSAVGLRSMPVRYLFLDEVDAYRKRSSGGTGFRLFDRHGFGFGPLRPFTRRRGRGRRELLAKPRG